MTRRTSLAALLFLAVLLPTAGCKEQPPAPKEPLGPDVWFEMRIGEVDIKVQVVVRPLELQKGLMHRPFLGDDEGMVFIYPEPGARSFWMRNTLIPLDIGFFTPKGELREVRAMNPLDENPTVSYSDDIQIGIETNQGWYHARGLKPGAQLDMKLLKAALVARGFDPKALGLR